MRKIIIVLLVFMLVITGCSENRQNEEKEKKDEDIEYVGEDSSDLFGKYYGKAQKLVKEMSLEEKVGQLFLIAYDTNASLKWIKNKHVGGFILFAKDFQNQTKDSLKKELDKRQEASEIPLLLGVDEEGGYVTRVSRFSQFRSEKFKSNRTLFETGGYPLIESSEKEKAKLLLGLGLNVNLAPVADVSTNPDDYIYIRTFGQDATNTAEYISKVVGYDKEAGLASCLKHFPGYGNNVDTHGGIAIDNRSYESFTTNDFLPFKAGIEAGVPFILVSHNVVTAMDSEYPASLSKKVINELRNTLNFSGIIITDDLAMGAIDQYTQNNNAATLAINAGNDMIITTDFGDMYEEVLESVKNKTISEETIDKAVKRIIAWKYAYGLFEEE